ncbi:MAG: hypothetical protein NXI00_13120 [Cytophagales bacterium]|nr:hypothetical protein [Cytophagales bacterium]
MKIKILITIIALVLVSLLFWGNVLFESNDYSVFNEEMKSIPASVFVNNLTVDNKEMKELIIYFKNVKTPKFITVAIDQNLIGSPASERGIHVVGETMIIKNESKMFVTLNEVPNTVIENYFVSDTMTRFNTFEGLKIYGQTIQIIKKE